jgi:cbb3-type cytochrome c oxidase subunit III
MKPFASLMMAALLAATALSASAAEEHPAHAPAAAAAPAAAKPDLAQGSSKFTAVCASCHGADGNSGIPANPKLAQQHPEYLVKQLQEFKGGKRPGVGPGTVMPAMAAQLSDADMKNIAYWAASQKGKAGFAKDKELVTLGERIYRGGIADRQVAACASCHGPGGAGIPSQYPRLSGQHADYTATQLTAFRDGGRKNSPQMTMVAAKLNDREIRAVADYIAGLR